MVDPKLYYVPLYECNSEVTLIYFQKIKLDFHIALRITSGTGLKIFWRDTHCEIYTFTARPRVFVCRRKEFRFDGGSALIR
jgi:hypothetical protein